jgi:aryl-alcohol dehydrogenase-like predicted oxidoreductase
MRRREFIDAALALIVTPRMARAAGERTAPKVSHRKLGRTGADVSCIGLGGYHIGHQQDPAESIRIIRRAIDGGITFLDNCWDYNGGASEIRMGFALRDGYRAKAFLMTKFDGRDRQTAAAQIDESLRRLQTDHVDLLQLHEVIRDDDPDRAFAAGGAIEAMLAARKAGKARFLGFTGHKSARIHLKMLDTAQANGFRFDAVQMPLNVMDAHHSDSFEKQVLPRLVREGIGALAMKPMGDPFILETGTVSARECLRYDLSLPVSVVITGIDSRERLDQALSVGQESKILSEKEISAILARTVEAAKSGSVEKYKTSHHFDGTVQHPEWLGPRAG